MQKSVRGFVLQRYRALDADVTFDILTEEGAELRLRAHGLLASKRRSGLMTEPGALVEVVYYAHGETGGSLKEGRVLERYEQAKSGYEGMLIVSHLLEICSRSLRAVDGDGLFTLLQGALVELEAAGADRSTDAVRLLLGFFRTRLARQIGVLSDPAHCTLCGNAVGPRALWLVPELAFQCSDCSDQASPLDARLARLTDHAARERYARFCRSAFEFRDVVPEWDARLLRSTEHFLGKALRTAPELYRRLGSSG